MTEIKTTLTADINPFKRVITLATNFYRTASNKMASQSDRTSKRMISDMRKYKNIVASIGTQFAGGWWTRFGSIAAGFTVAYRAINLMEAGMSRFSDILRDSIAETGELVSLQSKLAFWQRMHAQDAMTFGEAYKRAAVNVNTLYQASFNSLSSLSDLTTGMEEIAQTIGSVPPKLIPQLVSVIDFTTLVAQTTGSTTRQIRQELQALTQGEVRTTNILIRSMKNIGVLTEKDISDLKKMTNQTKILEKVFKAIDKEWKNVVEEILRSDPVQALQVWEKTARGVFIQGTRAASAMEDVKNVFADVIRTQTTKMFDQFTDKDWARLAMVMRDFASALGWVLSLFPKMVKLLGNLDVIIRNLNPEIKKATGYMWTLIKIGLGIKIFEKVYMIFSNLIKPVFLLTVGLGKLTVAFIAFVGRLAASLTTILAIPIAIGAITTSIIALYDTLSSEAQQQKIKRFWKAWADGITLISEDPDKPFFRRLSKEQVDNINQEFIAASKDLAKGTGSAFTDNFKTEVKMTIDYWAEVIKDLGGSIKESLPQSVTNFIENLGGNLDLEKLRGDLSKLIDGLRDIQGFDMDSLTGALEGEGLSPVEKKKGFWDTYREDLQKNFDAMEYMAMKTGAAMESAFAGSFFNVMKGDIKSLADVFQGFTDAILKMVSEMLAKMLMLKITGSSLFSAFGFGGGNLAGATSSNSMLDTFSNSTYAGIAHSGGVIGLSSFPGRRIPSSLFNFAPRLHKGLKSDEFPAILQKGETVIPKGSMPQGSSNTIIIQAMDAASFHEFLGRNANALSGPMDQVFKSNKGLRSTLRKVL